MVTVEFLGPIAREPMQIEAERLEDVAKRLQEEAAIREWLPKCAVAVNDTMVSDLNTPLKEGDKISILPPVCGG